MHNIILPEVIKYYIGPISKLTLPVAYLISERVMTTPRSVTSYANSPEVLHLCACVRSINPEPDYLT